MIRLIFVIINKVTNIAVAFNIFNVYSLVNERYKARTTNMVLV